MLDPPTVRLLGAPQIDLEEGKDALVLRCEADANPPASIVWKRAGRSEIASLQVSKMLINFPKKDFVSSFSISLSFIDVLWTRQLLTPFEKPKNFNFQTETQPTQYNFDKQM